MQPSRQHCLYASLALVLLSLLGPRAHADTLTITSTPPGATVEIDGVVMGKTPCKINYPGGFFHKTHSVFGEKLEHPMTVRVSEKGYTSSEISLTEGPFEWVALNGRDRGRYWLIKSKQINASLDQASDVFTGSVHTSLATVKNTAPRPELSAEQVVQIATPAVVKLRNPDGWGTGFLITDTGVIATNHHVTMGKRSLDVVLPDGKELPGTVVYTDDRLDLALVKVEGSGFPFLSLSDASQIHKGQGVIAIGNPDHGMSDTVTSGIVSAIGRNPDHDPGTWIQTDASINTGNSGGPLLNSHAEVIGINTQRAVQRANSDEIPLQGLAFALSVNDLIEVLHRFYPDAAPARLPSPPSISAPGGTGSVAIGSEPAGADIFVDGQFVGQTPSTVQLAAGGHSVEVKSQGKQSWTRNLDVISESQITLKAALVAAP
jgi:serine protease Do